LEEIFLLKVFVIICLLLASSNIVLAEVRQPITFAVYEFGYAYSESDKAGIDKDLALELAKRSGREFKIILMSRARIWKELESGDVMMTSSAIQTSSRDQFVYFVPIMSEKNYVITLKNSGFKNLSDFNQKQSAIFGVIHGFHHGKLLDAFVDNLQKNNRVHEVVEIEQLYGMLGKGRIDAFFGQRIAGDYYLKKLHMQDEVLTTDWFSNEPPVVLNIALSKKAFFPDEFTMWQKIIKTMLDDGTLEKIYAKYMGAEYAKIMLKDMHAKEY
jgi:polar amino acid transport system substrate-binding protein